MSKATNNAKRYDTCFSDNDLMLRVQTGDSDAFTELANRLYTSVLNLATPIVGKEYALDVLQETFLRMKEKASLWKPTGDVKGWILGIARNKSRDHLRKNCKPACVQTITELESGTSHNILAFALSNEAEPCAKLDQGERRELVRIAINALGTRQRQAITLSYIEGESGEECAKTMGISHDNFRKIVSRARNELRELLASYISG